MPQKLVETQSENLTLNTDMRFENNRTIEETVMWIQTRPGNYENLGKLIKINPNSLNASGKIDYLAALEKQYSWLASLIQDATLAIAGNEPSLSDGIFEGVDETEREDVATALRLSPNTAQSRIDVARTLSQHLPSVYNALATGDISTGHANLIAREANDALIRGVSPDILPIIEAKALAHCEFHTAAQVGKKMRTLFAKYAPEVFENRAEIARDSRNVRLYPEGDGMSTLIALLPSEDAQTVFLAINKMIDLDREQSCNYSPPAKFKDSPSVGSVGSVGSETDLVATEALSIEMKRADALARIASDFLARANHESPEGRRPVTLNLTMDLPTLLGLADNPAELAGHGPIPASVGRKLAADAKWRKFITDPITGNLIDMGRDSYQPSQYLVDFLTARDRTCRFPGCSQPSRVSDIDHAVPWEDGGNTDRSNLGFLCRRHHRMKTHGGWRIESNHDGSCTWTSPVGKKYFVPARPMYESSEVSP